MSFPPWAKLKLNTRLLDTDRDIAPQWTEPVLLILDKQYQIYRDLLKSTEKVELSLAHSGKQEVLDSFEDPKDPDNEQSKITPLVRTILVPIRFGDDPRNEFLFPDGRIGTRPEYACMSQSSGPRSDRIVEDIQERPQAVSSIALPGVPIIYESLNVAELTGNPQRTTPPPPPNRPPPPKAPPPVRTGGDNHPTKKQRSLH